MHNYTASFRDKVYVDETFEGDRVWRGSLYVFDLVGHPKATKCYAGRRLLRDQTSVGSMLCLKFPPLPPR